MSNLSIRDTISGSVSIGEGSTKGIIKGSVSIGKGDKGEQGPIGPVGPQGPIGDNNVCIGLSPTSEAEIWFDTNDGISGEEIATKKFVEERTVKLEISLDNLESEVNELKKVISILI